MLILKAFKFELMPNGAQSRKMKQFCGCARFVFNRALRYQNEQYEADKSFKFSYTKIANLLPKWKRELVWLKGCHSQVLQQSLKDLESSFKNFFAKRADFPKFKRKGKKDRFRFPQGRKLEQQNNRIWLPKIGWVRYRNSPSVGIPCLQAREDVKPSNAKAFEVKILTRLHYHSPSFRFRALWRNRVNFLKTISKDHIKQSP